MTFQGRPDSSVNNILKTLIVVTILVVAVWASLGGMDRNVVPANGSVSSTTLGE